MVLFNFWHLKAKNGMFYFGCDYLSSINVDRSKTLIIYRTGVFEEGDFPSSFKCVGLDFYGYLWFILKARLKGWGIFSPTVHCIPFYPKQISVLHDYYPFDGEANRLKRWALIFMLFIGRGYVGGINCSAVLPFLKSRGFTRVFYCPNLVSTMEVKPVQNGGVRSGCSCDSLRVGLVGTDSDKKRYDILLECSSSVFKKFELVFFGTDTNYYQQCHTKLSSFGYSVSMVNSSSVGLEKYLTESIDVLMSVATGEGFCRPVAQAAFSNVPVFLLKDSVFVEFYSETAVIRNSFTELVAALENRNEWVCGDRLFKAANSLQSDIRNDSSRSISFISDYLG